MSTNELENLLRQAPQPKPPGNLKQRLVAQALSAPRLAAEIPRRTPQPGSWLARWWPALAPTAISLACAGVLTVQQVEMRKLKTTQESSAAQPVEPKTAAPAVRSGSAQVAGTLDGKEQEELTRLRSLAANLNGEVSRLEGTRAENDRLRSQLASSTAGELSPDEIAALDKARDRAFSIQCINNLKQLGLAVKIWALDHTETTPPDFSSMSNELGSFKILVCPADTGRQAAKDPAGFTPANASYQYMAPSLPDNEPDRVCFRCPIHGHITLADGSVQSNIAKDHPEWIVQRDGKYYFQRNDSPASQGSPAPSSGSPTQ